MITGVVLARNEESNIVQCLRALEPHVAEIIVIDMESTDRTVELARPYSDKLLFHPWVPNFDAARNLATAEAKHDWLWFVDADEWVTDNVGRMVNDAIQNQGHSFEAINIPFMSHFCGQWIRHCGWWPGYTCPRVLKRGYFEFSRQLHGGVKHTGREIRFPADPKCAVPHHSYKNVEHWLRKCNGYTTTESAQLSEQGVRWDWRLATRLMMRDLWGYFEMNRGREDGDRGWILSWLSGQYRWLSVAKLIDSCPSGSRTSVPESLDEVLQVMRDEVAACRALSAAAPSASRIDQIGVAIEGEFFAGHSFSNINEQLVLSLAADDRLAITLHRYPSLTTRDNSSDRIQFLNPYFDRHLPGGPDVTLRHAYPPNWRRPPQGKWIHIQPWEYGHLPANWVPPLRDEVDEIWVPSRHVGKIYTDSGIPSAKIHVVPWGVDLDCFSPAARPANLKTTKAFRFLYVGGTIWRKGFDRLLDAYLGEFTAEDDVALVVKDVGTQSFYPVNFQQRIIDAQQNPLAPEIVYLDSELEAEELAGLYSACHCLAAPFRGEGFCLPVLEALACGLPVIVPQGGPTDEFVSAAAGKFLASRRAEIRLDAAPLPGKPFTVLETDVGELRRAMRSMAGASSQELAAMRRAARLAAEPYSWSRTAQLMADRIAALCGGHEPMAAGPPRNDVGNSGGTSSNASAAPAGRPVTIAACVTALDDERRLPDILCCLRPYVDELLVADRGSSDRSAAIAAEYGAEFLRLDGAESAAALVKAAKKTTSDWVLFLDAGRDRVDEETVVALCELVRCQPTIDNEIAPAAMPPTAGLVLQRRAVLLAESSDSVSTSAHEVAV